MSDRAPYCRVYWSVIDDPKFAEVYDDDHALACWLRLLIAADALWPAPASLPASARKSAVALLVRVGLVDLQIGGRYRIHGLDAERGRRRDAATRPGTNRDPDGTQGPPARDPEVSELPDLARAPASARLGSASLGSATESPAREAEPALDAYQAIMVNVSRDALNFLDDLVAAHGQEATARAIGEASLKGKDKLLSRAKTLLVLRERQADKDELRAEKQRVSAHRAPLVREVQPEETPEQAAKAEAASARLRELMAGMGLPGSQTKPKARDRVGPVPGVLT
jgi:hypothetical protein